MTDPRDELHTREDLRSLSAVDFRAMGINRIAYVRPVRIMGRSAFAIHAADGTQLTVMDDMQTAHMLALQNDVEIVTVH